MNAVSFIFSFLSSNCTFYQPFVRLRGHTREALMDESFDNKLGLIFV